MEFSVTNLPIGLTVDKRTGRITGTLPSKGEFIVTLGAKNSLGGGEAIPHRLRRHHCADAADGVEQLELLRACGLRREGKSAADAMVRTGLINHGWTYINIDDYWQNHIPTDEKDLQDFG